MFGVKFLVGGGKGGLVGKGEGKGGWWGGGEAVGRDMGFWGWDGYGWW